MAYKIFVDGIMHLGDIMIAASIFPVLKKHHPDSEITFLTQAALAPAASLIEDVDRIIPYEYKSGGGALGVWRMAQKLRREHFDIGISVDPRERVTLMKWLAGIPIRVTVEEALGWKLGWERHFYTTDVSLSGWDYFSHRRSESFQEAMKRYFHDDDKTFYPPRLKPSSEKDLDFVDRLLENASHDGPLIALCVQTTGDNRLKEWRAERYSELCDRIAEEYNASFVMTGIEAHRERADEIINGTHHIERFISATGKTTLPELIALFRRVDALVTCDTGTAHIAGAAGCPVLTICTSAWPDVYRACGENCRVASARVPCTGRANCRIMKTCNKSDCYDKLTVDMVMDEFAKMMEKHLQ